MKFISIQNDKNISNLFYDAYSSCRLILSWSSRWSLIRSGTDLSRRVTLYEMSWLRFDEYCMMIHNIAIPSYSFEQVRNNTVEASNEVSSMVWVQLNILWNAYMHYWYYAIIAEGESSNTRKLWVMIDKVIYEDIATLYSLKTDNLVVLKRILRYLAQRSPGTININTVASAVQKSHSVVSNYIIMLEETNLLTAIYAWNSWQPFDWCISLNE